MPSQINIKHATGEKPGNNGWRAGGGGNGGGGGAEDELLGAEKPTKQSFDLLTVKTDKTRHHLLGFSQITPQQVHGVWKRFSLGGCWHNIVQQLEIVLTF